MLDRLRFTTLKSLSTTFESYQRRCLLATMNYSQLRRRNVMLSFSGAIGMLLETLA
jgi:hypothetical protein